MEIIENISQWINQHPTSSSIIRYLIWIIFIVITITLFRRLLRKKLPDTSVRYKSQKAIEVLGYFLIIIITISYFTGSIKDFALAIGLLTAGITITLQELILSIVYFYSWCLQTWRSNRN